MKSNISIITVVKNDENNIIKTIKSTLNQKKCQFEYIVCDGDSKDLTSKKIINYKKKNSKKFIYIRSKDKNLYDGINKAIKKAKGEYIFLLHSGDIFKSNLTIYGIYKQLNNKLDLLSGNLAYFKISKGKRLISRVWRHPIKKIDNFSVFKIPHTTILIKKKILNKLNFYNTRFDISSDMDLMIRLNKLNKKINYHYIDEHIIYMKEGGASTDKKKFFKKLFQDFIILFNHYKIFFFVFYAYKIHFKIFDFYKRKI